MSVTWHVTETAVKKNEFVIWLYIHAIVHIKLEKVSVMYTCFTNLENTLICDAIRL